MISSSRRATRENTIGKNSTVVTKSKGDTETEPVTLPYDYETVISRRDTPPYSEVDDKVRSRYSNHDDALSTSVDARKLYVRGKGSATAKKRGIGFRSRVQTGKKVTKVYSQIRDVVEIEIDSSNVPRDIENFGTERSGVVAASQEVPFNLYQVFFPKLSYTLIINLL